MLFDDIRTPAYWIWINEKKQQNSAFGERHRALEWNHHEIAYWLKTIKCGNYCKQFVEEKVNGEALLNDVDSKVLSQELGVKMLHAGKIKREIDKLKATVGVGFGISGFDNFKYVPGPDEANRNEELGTNIIYCVFIYIGIWSDIYVCICIYFKNKN